MLPIPLSQFPVHLGRLFTINRRCETMVMPPPLKFLLAFACDPIDFRSIFCHPAWFCLHSGCPNDVAAIVMDFFQKVHPANQNHIRLHAVPMRSMQKIPTENVFVFERRINSKFLSPVYPVDSAIDPDYNHHHEEIVSSW